MNKPRIHSLLACTALFAAACGSGGTATATDLGLAANTVPEALAFADSSVIFLGEGGGESQEEQRVMAEFAEADSCEAGWDVLDEHYFAAADIFVDSVGEMTAGDLSNMDSGDVEMLVADDNPAVTQMFTVGLWMNESDLCGSSETNPACQPVEDRYGSLPIEAFARTYVFDFAGC